MTVQNTNRKDVYTTNGTTIYWPYTFKIFTTDGSDLRLYETNISTGETSEITANLTKEIENSRIKYPTSGEPRPTGYKITVARVTERTQGTTLSTQSFDPKNMEKGLDKLTAIVQELDETVNRAAISDISNQNATYEFPAPVPEKVIGWNSDGTAFINYDNPAAAYIAAQNAAAAAEVSKNNAAISEANAAAAAAEAIVFSKPWRASTAYTAGSMCNVSSYSYIMLECTAITGDGKTGTVEPTITEGIITDNHVTWLVHDLRANVINVKWFGAKGDGTTNDTTAIQAAHDYSVSCGSTLGFPKVVFPAGTYIISSLNWSPLIHAEALGKVVLQSSIASGKGIYVSTRFGNWADTTKQIPFGSNGEIFKGDFVVYNSLVGNTACAMFLGDDGNGAYSAESITFNGLKIIGWAMALRFGSHAYIDTFINCKFASNGSAIQIDVNSNYIDRLERTTFINCIFNNSVAVLAGDSGYSGEFFFESCSFDYNTSVIQNIQSSSIVKFTNCHFEWNSNTTLMFSWGSSISLLNNYFYFSGTTPASPLVGAAGANGYIQNVNSTYSTPVGAVLYTISASSGVINAESYYKQFGGAAGTYISNVGGGISHLY